MNAQNVGMPGGVPTFSVDGAIEVTHIAGMSRRDADKMSHRKATDRLGSLRAAGITGFFRPAQLQEAGLTRDQLPALVRSGQVERIGRGLYRLADAEPTENYSLAMACARVPNSVVCLLSALRVHGIGTQAPAEVWLAIPHKARAPRLREVQLRIVRFSGPAWTFGVKETEFEGVSSRITSPARTVADCFRFERLVGPETAMESLQDALRQRKVTIAELSRVAEVLPSRRLTAALDVRSI
jgi:predicted transcriptional regulator of viral defense system